MKMVYVLVGAIAAAAAIGGVRSFTSSPTPTPEPVAVAPAAPESRAPHGGNAADAPDQNVVEGDVLEVIDVPNYSYLRLGAKGSDGKWVAVPTAKLVVGGHAKVVGAMEMANFKSTALNRTFPVIYFGTLDDGTGGNAAKPGVAGGPNPHAAGADTAASGAPSPHAKGSAAPVEAKPVPKAAGPNGKTVAEVIGKRAELAGKTVKIRGTVVKVTANVMGKTYLHLRDGTGDASAGTNDITVTTQATPAVGEVVVVEGVVATDRDIGSGYKFPTIVEEAKLLKE